MSGSEIGLGLGLDLLDSDGYHSKCHGSAAIDSAVPGARVQVFSVSLGGTARVSLMLQGVDGVQVSLQLPPNAAALLSAAINSAATMALAVEKLRAKQQQDDAQYVREVLL